MTEPNIPLLRKVVEWVEHQDKLSNEKREWSQSYWFRKPKQVDTVIIDGVKFDWSCGTSYCVAGKVALDAGWIPMFQFDETASAVARENDQEALNTPWGEEFDDLYDEERIRDVEDVAQEILGLTLEQADLLFSGENSARTIRRLCEEFAGEQL